MKYYLIKFINPQGKLTLVKGTIDDVKRYSQEGVLKEAGKYSDDLVRRWTKDISAPNKKPKKKPSTKNIGKEYSPKKEKPINYNSIPGFSSLSPDEQSFIKKISDFVSTKGTQENIDKIQQALKDAEQQVNPYWAEQLRIAQDTLKRKLKQTRETFENQAQTLQDRIDRINEDLATQKDRLTLDQQADLARQKENYKQQLDTLRNNIANQGLTFSSNRNKAESRLYGNYYNPDYGVIESTKRKYQRALADLQKEASRGSIDAQRSLNSLRTNFQNNITSLWRNTEKALGTANLPSLPGSEQYKPLGNIGGEWARNRELDIQNWANKLLQLQNPFTFK